MIRTVSGKLGKDAHDRPTFAVPEDADERQGVAVRHAIDRLRHVTAAADALYRQWHERAAEATALREELTAITGSRGFRLLQLAYGTRRLLIPPGSFRERLALCLSLVGRAAVLERPAAAGGRNSAAMVPATAAAAYTVDGADRPSAPEAQAEVPDLTYAPRQWRLVKPAPPDAESIHLIILSPAHRSGSTLLQRICNARKGTLIWGEHGGLLSRFADIYRDVAYFSSAGSEEHREDFGSGEDPNLWIASMCPALEYVQQAVVDLARAFLGAFYGQYREHHDVLGFKEVAYGQSELELLRRCYPRARILFLVRNPLNTWRSTPRSWHPSLDGWIAEWTARTLCFCAFARNDPGSHLIRYEDLIRKEPGAMAVLARAAKVSDEQVSMVLAHKLGSHDAGISAAERDAILDRCREPMKLLGY